MKKTRFETEVHGKSLSEELAGARILCDREGPALVEWFAKSGERLWDSLQPEIFQKLEFFSNRSTGLKLHANASISTVEHLAPVLLLYPQFHFEIHALSKELPLFDGSAYPWYETIRKLAGIPQELQFYPSTLHERFDWGYGFMEVCPAETLEIEYSISHGTFHDDAYASIYEAADLVSLFPARTFIFESDVKQAKESGFLAAADETCGMLLSEQGDRAQILFGGNFRMQSEPVKHKILDLIGDLSLPAPILPKLRIRIHNGGHVAHRKLSERLLNDAFRYSSQIN